MGDVDLRRILQDTIRDIDKGRIVIKRPRRSLLRRMLAPGLVAVSMSAACCDGRGIGTTDDDATVGQDASYRDVRIDSSIGPEYGMFFIDAAPDAWDSETEDGGVLDGAIDSGDIPVYMGPPPQD